MRKGNKMNFFTRLSNQIGNLKAALSKDLFQDLFLLGLWNTLKIAILGLLIGILIGTVIAVIKVAPKYKWFMRFLDKLCDIYVAIFRGTPMIVQLLIPYYIILPLLGVKGVDAVVVGIVVFGMNSGAYVAEIMRGGLNSVDIGQMEAGRALGLGYVTTMIKVVIPQAIKNILPTLGNEFITLIKETSVLSFITIRDVYNVIKNEIAAPSYSQDAGYLLIALVYIVLILFITLLIKILEGILSKSDRRNAKPSKKAQKSL